MLKFALSFLLGISQVLWLPTVNSWWLFLPLLLSAVLVIFFVKNQKSLNKTVFALSLGFLLGLSYVVATAYLQKQRQLQCVPAASVVVQAEIVGLAKIKHDKIKFIANIKSIQSKGFKQTGEKIKVKKLLLTWYDDYPQIQAGQLWQLELKLKPNNSYYNPGSYDYSKWLFRHKIDATATVKNGQFISQNKTFDAFISQLRLKIAAVIEHNVNSQRVSALLRALSIGDKSQIEFADAKLFQQTGTAHLIAISGLHIGLMAFVGLLLARFVFFLLPNERFNRQKYEAIFSLAFALFYAVLAGLSLPTIRALVMVTVFAFAHVSKTPVSRWQAWSVAMMVVLVFDPLSVLDVGFWFSFGAVALLMFAFSGRKLQKNKILLFVQAQIIILIGLLPFMLIVFHKVNLLTPFANLLVLPLASFFIIPLLFLSLFSYMFSTYVAHFLFQILQVISQLFFSILDFMQQFSFINIDSRTLNTAELLALFLFALVFLLPRFLRLKVMALFLLLPLFLQHAKSRLKDEFVVHVLDVGQGLSVVIMTQNHSLVYDTGAKFDSGFSLAHAVVIPFLQSQGVKKIDKLILSHADNDHAGGEQDLLEYSPEAEVLAVRRVTSASTKLCHYPLAWHYDGVLFEILSPYNQQPYLGNDSSCVLKVSSKNGSILLTADIQLAIEYRLIHQFADKIQSDVLVVPHHGSKTSSSLPFLQKVKAKTAINSSGLANQFHHPHAQIKQRYHDLGIRFMDTQNLGMISLEFKHDKNTILSYKNQHPHVWHVHLSQ